MVLFNLGNAIGIEKRIRNYEAEEKQLLHGFMNGIAAGKKSF